MIFAGTTSASELPVVGKTVHEIKAFLPSLDIPAVYQLTINGEPGDSSHVIQANDEIWILPSAGDKGQI